MVVYCATPEMSRGLQRELRRHYAAEGFDAVIVESCDAARGLLQGERDVAMLIAEQAGKEPDALDLVRDSRELQPDARTVITTPHTAMKPALAAMGDGTLDYFFVEPVGSLEEQVFPLLSDLLEDWKAWRGDATNAVHVIGPSRDPESHAACDFLARNDIHYLLLDPASGPGRALAQEAGADGGRLPLVVLGDGSRLAQPSTLELAKGLGLPTEPQHGAYDLIVIGGGPAGLAASVYGASEGLSTLLIEAYAPGGQAGQSSKIENYLGFTAGVKGRDLAQRALRQALRFGAEVVRLLDVAGLEERGGERIVRLAGGSELSCSAAVIATGVAYRRMEAPGVDDLLGRGVYYGAAMTDAESQRDRRVFIVGGANSAGQAALHFAEHAESVTILVRADSLEARMSSYLVNRIRTIDNIEVLTGTEVSAASGTGQLESLTLSPVGGGEPRTVPAEVLFIFIGAVPRTDWLGTVARDERGFVLTGPDLRNGLTDWPLNRDPLPLETSMSGVFAAGDVRHGSTKRVASAVGEGAMAVQLVHQYLAEREAPASGEAPASP